MLSFGIATACHAKRSLYEVTLLFSEGCKNVNYGINEQEIWYYYPPINQCLEYVKHSGCLCDYLTAKSWE